ncbi:hypothetical protein [Nostoc sp. 2RC]|uniref:hypothetical protein n=1 Tax=Nostoc sp. 2RC TaxID=2485484 RepID=UPI0016273639|nr:hypothetical protein [Nostoc sp. 2RC]
MEEKLNLDEFLLNKTSVYQTTSLYKEAYNNFISVQDGDDIAKGQFIQLTEQFRNERWKIFYEFALWCVHAYKKDPYWFYEDTGIEFTCKSIGCLIARDSPIQLTMEEKSYAPLLLLQPIYKMNPKIADDIVIKWGEIMAEINPLNSLSSLIY